MANQVMRISYTILYIYGNKEMVACDHEGVNNFCLPLSAVAGHTALR